MVPGLSSLLGSGSLGGDSGPQTARTDSTYSASAGISIHEAAQAPSVSPALLVGGGIALALLGAVAVKILR